MTQIGEKCLFNTKVTYHTLCKNYNSRVGKIERADFAPGLRETICNEHTITDYLLAIKRITSPFSRYYAHYYACRPKVKQHFTTMCSEITCQTQIQNLFQINLIFSFCLLDTQQNSFFGEMAKIKRRGKCSHLIIGVWQTTPLA